MSSGELHAFYCSKEWRAFRDMIIKDRSEHGIKCQDCNKFIFKSDQIHIHHTPIELTEHNYKDKTISLNPDNVRTICTGCHDKAHARFCKGARKKEQGVYLVAGPPMAGKRTYVEQNMMPGDLVIDIDKLYEAVSFREAYDKPDNLKFNVFAIKNLLINNVKTRYGNFKSAWIIGGYPNRVERERVANELGAEIILLDTSKDECIMRLSECSDYRGTHKTEYMRYIDDWFEKYS